MRGQSQAQLHAAQALAQAQAQAQAVAQAQAQAQAQAKYYRGEAATGEAGQLHQTRPGSAGSSHSDSSSLHHSPGQVGIVLKIFWKYFWKYFEIF